MTSLFYLGSTHTSVFIMSEKMDKPAMERIETVRSDNDSDQKDEMYQKAHDLSGANFTGAVQLADGDVTYLIPTPSADPRGPPHFPRIIAHVH